MAQRCTQDGLCTQESSKTYGTTTTDKHEGIACISGKGGEEGRGYDARDMCMERSKGAIELV